MRQLSPADAEISVSSDFGSEDGFNVLDAALPKNLADPRDKGKTPKTVLRKCTNVAWIFPFLALFGVCGWITHIAARVGKPAIMFRPPNFQGELCGKRRYHGMKFLFFCLRESQAANQSLEIRYPICVKECPNSSNTSRSCYTGKGEASDVHAWQSTRDYPTQPLMYFCRPHRDYTMGLGDDFWTALSKGPPTSYFVAAHYSGWPEVLAVSISASTLFSLFYLMLLSKYSRTFIWLSLTVLLIFAAATFCVYGYCFKEGCHFWTGQGAGHLDDLFKCLGAGLCGFFLLRTMNNLHSDLDMVGRTLEMACSCILSGPVIAALPIGVLAVRICLTVWLLYVLLCLYGFQVHDKLTEVENPWTSEWFKFPPVDNHEDFWMYMIVSVLFYIWCIGTSTSVFYYCNYYVGQVWFFARGKVSLQQCNAPTALYSCIRYHFGTMILSGLFIVLVGPLHATLGRLRTAADAENSVAELLYSCFASCLDFYSETLAHLERNALQDVSLQAFEYFEGAEHAAEVQRNTSTSEEVMLLKASYMLFQAAGVGCAGVIAWFASVLTLSQEQFTDEDSQYYVRDKSLVCLGGVIFSAASAMHFMFIFDVVGEALIYSEVVDEQRNPVKTQVTTAADHIMRHCTPWGQMMADITSCHCGSRSLPAQNFPGTSIFDWAMDGAPSDPLAVPAPMAAKAAARRGDDRDLANLA